MKTVLLAALLYCTPLAAADVWVYWIDPVISTDYSRLKRT